MFGNCNVDVEVGVHRSNGLITIFTQVHTEEAGRTSSLFTITMDDYYIYIYRERERDLREQAISCLSQDRRETAFVQCMRLPLHHEE